MVYRKGQKQSTDLSKSGLNANEIHEFILNKIGLKTGKEYSLKDIIENIMNSELEILSVHRKSFDVDLYKGMKGSILDSKFQRKAIASIILDNENSTDEFIENLDHLEDKEVITETSITTGLKKEGFSGKDPIIFNIYGKDSEQIISLKLKI